MGHSFTYSLGEGGSGVVRGSPSYLIVVSTLARELGRSFPTDLIVEGLTERMHHRDAEQVRRDYETVAACINPYPFRVHSTINDVPRRVLETQREQEIAYRARPLFQRFIKGLTKSDGHFGDVVVLGAHPVLIGDLSDLPPPGDDIYKVRPFSEALELSYEKFHIPYEVSLDLEGFKAWTTSSRENFGAHITLVDRIEQGCLPLSV